MMPRATNSSLLVFRAAIARSTAAPTDLRPLCQRPWPSGLVRVPDGKGRRRAGTICSDLLTDVTAKPRT
jgi:hypothetical protein